MSNSQIILLIVINITTIIPLFLWNASQARSDIRMIIVMINLIQDEMKNLHVRLSSIEEKHKSEKK